MSQKLLQIKVYTTKILFFFEIRYNSSDTKSTVLFSRTQQKEVFLFCIKILRPKVRNFPSKLFLMKRSSDFSGGRANRLTALRCTKFFKFNFQSISAPAIESEIVLYLFSFAISSAI